ncbi:MAG TPA: DUF6580 family putative transport protein [Candidatus Omnitrophota bacterium]|nr:DUF6580 family putative transport protein [Candidatus Omnitrophota bacterium]
MLALAIIVLGVLSRAIVHIPNFTPVIAIALFSGVYFEKKQAIILPLVLLAISDILIGFHNTMFFTWGSILLIVGIGIWLKKRKSLSMVLASTLASSILFFIVSNLGVWLTGGLYPLTAEGLKTCFILAIPFFDATLLSTFVYMALFFGAYEWITSRMKAKVLARAL